MGVFLAAPPAEMAAVARRAGLTHLQVHECDPAEARRAAGLPVIEGIRVTGPTALERARASAADMVMLDAAVPGRHGGTGAASTGGCCESTPWSARSSSPVASAPATWARRSPPPPRDRGRVERCRVGARAQGPRAGPRLRRGRRGGGDGRGVRDDQLAARFGPFGGRYVPETVIGALDELEAAYLVHREDVAFRAELEGLLARYVGRPTPLYRAAGLEAAYGVAPLYLKREDLCHTGAHKINNALGQVLLASRMGKRRIIAETGAGQHGVATATAAALLGLECCVYMGRVDMARQRLNVIRMRMLGAEVRPVDSGIATLKDALNEAIRDWVTNVRDTHYVIGTAAGPAPYPEIVAELQSVIGAEAREQMLAEEGRLPEVVVACVGGGSNAIGIFRAFLGDDGVALVGVEAGGEGSRPAATAPRSGTGSPACCTAPTRTCSRRLRARWPSRTRCRPGSTTRASGRSTASFASRAASAMRARPTPRPSRPSATARAPRASSRARERPCARARRPRAGRPGPGRRPRARVPVGPRRQGRRRGGRRPGPR